MVEKRRRVSEVVVKPSQLARPQFKDGLGVFAARSFVKGELVIRWNLRTISEAEYRRLPEEERTQFCHRRGETIYLYPDPERHVNRSDHPNLVPDFRRGADVALRGIERGEELTIAETLSEDW